VLVGRDGVAIGTGTGVAEHGLGFDVGGVDAGEGFGDDHRGVEVGAHGGHADLGPEAEVAHLAIEAGEGAVAGDSGEVEAAG
jgi:hypothetical protein